ncbi:MAG: NeuD/PglB/VioB family sugar acetyltransferase [Opitutae bacterium]|nr:NeuD/PglB/VioB family sugar acetyltransferase [Opitutae bacterium]
MKTDKSLVVIGAGGFSAEVVDAAELAGWTVTALYDDDESARGRVVMGRPCLGPISHFELGAQGTYIMAIGANDVRLRIAARLGAAGHRAVAVIDPRSAVSRSAEIGAGAYIAAGAFVGPQVQVGQHVIVNVGVSVGHDAVIGDFSQLCPGARVSGFAVLGEGAFMGSNAVLGPRGNMGEWSLLGAASFANRAVAARVLAVGVPARSVAT